MNKRELIAAIADSAELTKKDSEAALNAFVKTVEEELAKGESVQLIGFGTFDVTQREARTGVNPRTGKKIKIKASKAPRFRAGASLKKEVNVKKTSRKKK